LLTNTGDAARPFDDGPVRSYCPAGSAEPAGQVHVGYERVSAEVTAHTVVVGPL